MASGSKESGLEEVNASALDSFTFGSSVDTRAVVIPTATASTPVTPEPPEPENHSDEYRPPNQGSNSTALIGAIIAGVLVAIIVILVFKLRGRRRARETEQPHPHSAKDTTAYTSALTPRTEPCTTGTMWGGMTMSMLRIPYDKVQIGEVISQGGFGEVLHGIYNRQHVAVKRLLAARRKDKVNVDSFFAEIQLTSTLDHECIIRFIGVAWDAPSNLCMITEFVGGGDLRTLLNGFAKRGSSNGYNNEKLRIAIQVSHALTYLHSLQPVVVHRDLKSRNILLTEDRNAKLIDFGVSTEQRDLTMTAGVGTSLWMAPEIMMGKRYDEKADVFSFGVVLSELDTHELPYSHARDASSPSGRKMPDLLVMQSVAQGKLIPRFTEAANPEVVALGNECLVVDPKLRPPAAEVLYRLQKASKRA